MRIAILADIHGNAIALEAVLKDLTGRGTVDQIIVAGDYFAPGPETGAIVVALQQLPQVCFLRGNTDRYLLDRSYTTAYGPKGWQGQLRQAFSWTTERLEQVEWDFLASLPFSQIIKAGDRQLLSVHGSPYSDEEGLTVDTRASNIKQMLTDFRISLLSCGHTHVPMDRIVGRVRVVNVGSVGLPFDGDPRASYAIITNLEAPTPEDISVELLRVVYDTEKAAQRFYAVKHPTAEMGAYNVRNGLPRGNTNIYQK